MRPHGRVSSQVSHRHRRTISRRPRPAAGPGDALSGPLTPAGKDGRIMRPNCHEASESPAPGDPVRSGRPRRPDRLGARRAAGLRVCSGGRGVVGRILARRGATPISKASGRATTISPFRSSARRRLPTRSSSTARTSTTNWPAARSGLRGSVSAAKWARVPRTGTRTWRRSRGAVRSSSIRLTAACRPSPTRRSSDSPRPMRSARAADRRTRGRTAASGTGASPSDCQP